MKIIFKKLSLKDNIEIVKWTLFDENEISNFRHYAIELFPELENVKENETSRIEELVTKKYNESLNTIESEIERYTNLWNKYNDKYFSELSNYLNVEVPFDKVIAYIGIIPVFPRDITDHTFDLGINLTPEKVIEVCTHETLHFFWFQKWLELYPNTKREELEFPHKVWQYSEMVTDPVLNNELFNSLFPFIEKAYDSFYELKDKDTSVMDNLKNIFNEEIPIEDKIKKGYIYISSLNL